jgi:predicted aldo/keto reductase-like oxidoreductase
VLKRVPRKEVVILTKTHASTADEMRADLDRFGREIGTDYLDVVLLHCMTSADWPNEKSGAMEVLDRAREQGRIRAHGVSCHDLGAIHTAVRNPWVQVQFQRINPLGVPMDAEPATIISLLKQAKANQQAVIGMKILAEGRLSSQPDLALRHAIRLDCLDAFTIGVTNRPQFDDIAERLPRVSVA